MPTRQCRGCQRNRTMGATQRVCDSCQIERRRRTAKDRRLRETYGITLEEFEALLEAQRGSDGQVRCAGCLETRAGNYRWSVDHDHRVEELEGVRASIRGLLCRRCNKVLRDVRDNYMVLASLVDYLHWSRRRVQEILARQI